MEAYPVIAFSGTRTLLVWVSPDDTLAKAAKGDIPPGARWITVHPNGDDEKGVPVLIAETQPGSGVHHVIGGAGGKLNYLKLRGVKPEGSYRADVAEKRKAAAEEKKRQREVDKQLGLTEKKRAAKREIAEKITEARKAVIERVASAMGWEEAKFKPEVYENLSVAAQNKAYHEHQREWLTKAREAVDAQRKQLLVDHEARSRVVEELPPEDEDPDTISLADLSPIPESSSGLGFSPNYKAQAERKGATEEAIKAEKAAIEASRPEDTKEATTKRQATVNALTEELATVHASETPKDAPVKLVEAEKAVELIKAEKELRMLEQQARKLSGKIDKSKEAPGAFVLEVGSEEVDAAVRREFEGDLRTASTVTFLSESARLGATAKHLGIGSYNALNGLSVAVAGDGLISRTTLDVVGMAGAAQILARRLHNDLGPDEVERTREALEQYHLDHYMSASDAAIGEAVRWQKVAEDLEVPESTTGDELAQAQEINDKRRDAIEQARRIMGQTLGEMETNAAMITALRQRPRDSIEVSLGDMSPEAAVRRARATGLQAGDYEINSVGSTRFLTIKAAGMDRLASAVNKEDLAITRRAIDILAGKEDEDGWMPEGMASRPDLVSRPSPGIAHSLAEPFSLGEDMRQSIEDYIAGRAADGDAARDIIADLRTSGMMDLAGDRRAEFATTVDQIAPIVGADGKPVSPDSLQPAFEALADKYVERRFGSKRSPLHRQNIPVDDTAVEALHRALSANPTATMAFKPAGELTRKEQNALRDHWWKTVGSKDNSADDAREELKKLDENEPNKTEMDMFGEEAENPAWRQWKEQRDGLAEEINAKGLSWPKYAQIMGGPHKAYAAVQDILRGDVAKSFAETYNTLAPKSPLKVGRAMIEGHLSHLDATDPAAREKRLAEHRQLVDDLHERDVRGQYAQGSVFDKIAGERAERDALAQAQMGLFFDEPEPEKERALAPGERHTLGVAAERTLAGMIEKVGQNFEPGKPVKLWHGTMDGKYINQQRAVKLLDNSKRLVLSQGVGSGKTRIGLGSFAHLHSAGKVKRGIFAVPSVVQGQFGGEALRVLDPGKFKWHSDTGATREQRLAAYRDPETHFAVVTHQALRDDMLYLGAKAAGIETSEMADRVKAMTGPERKAWMAETMAGAGMDHNFFMVDEGHDLLNRAGKEDSLMANVLDSIAHNSEYFVSASADPIKNDPSELYSLLNKVDPDRYNDPGEFKRRYGVDTPASKDALRREMARYHFPGAIDPGVSATKTATTVDLSPEQISTMQQIEKASAAARLARMRGTVDVEAMKVLSPSSFAHADKGKHAEIAKKLSANLGIIRDAAQRRVIDEHPKSAKADEISRIAKDRAGQPGVVFAHSRAAVAALTARLRAEGHRVVSITGSDTPAEKDRKRLMFHPERGEPEADILIASDAGAVGLNLQRGRWLVQHDTPMTAKTWAQRNGRIHRLGQKNNVDLIDLVGNHKSERAARERLYKKNDLREMLTSSIDSIDDEGLAGYLARARTQDRQNSLF